MPKRSKNWDEVLQKELRKPKFAREYIEASLAEGLAIQSVLAQVIRSQGVVEYAAMVGIAAPNLQRILRFKANPTLDTLQKLLAPLRLKLGVMESSPKPKRADA
ncbi:MAG: DNA-binding protein [Bdellovibrionia bacterium]